MGTIGFSFLLTSLAGLSTMIGVIPIFIKIKNKDKIIAASLSFASGVMLCVSITDLIPESINMIRGYYSGLVVVILSFLFILIGVAASCLVDKYLPTINYQSLYRVGIISMLAIILHNIPEGIATFISTTKDTSLGFSLATSIAFHNIPEGISISIPIYYSTRSKFKACGYTFISALSEPLGAVLTYLFLLPFVSDILLGLLFSFIAGIMLQISLTELLPEAISYKESFITKLFFVVGFIFMLLKVFI